MKRQLIALATGALAATMLAGCSSSPASPTTSATTPAPAATNSSPAGPASSTDTSAAVTLVAPGTLTVCTNPPFKPMEYADDSGNIVGFDLDVMGLVAAKLGVSVNPINTDFAQITSGAAMAAKKCDIGASSITITDARKQAVTFSAPYFSATQALAAKSSSGITGLADMKGKNLAVQTDTTGADYANQYSSQYGYTVVVFDDGGTALNAILSGKADATLIDLPIVADFVASNPGTAMVTQFQTGEQYGFAMTKDANGAALASVVNQVLQTAVADGSYLKIYQKWIDPKATSISLPS